MQMTKRFIKHIAAGTLASAVVAQSAFAAGPDYSAVTSGIDFSTAIVGALALAALMGALYGAIKGAKILLGMIRG
jgi:hypothetical protein